MLSKVKISVIECGITRAKSIHKLGNIAYYIGIKPPSVDELRARIKAGTGASTLDVNVMLDKAVKAIEEMQNCSFFSNRITSDEFETSYKNFENAITTLYPYLKTSYDDIASMMLQRKEANEERVNEASTSNQ